MPTRVKITINDDSAGRAALDVLYEGASQVALCLYALRLAAHTMETAGYNNPHNPAITTGFAINRQWQAGAARMHDVRQAGFAVHKLARQTPDELTTAVLRIRTYKHAGYFESAEVDALIAMARQQRVVHPGAIVQRFVDRYLQPAAKQH